VTLELEFTVEPFEPGAPGPHVRAAEEAARTATGALSIGPFGTSVSGSDDAVLEAVAGVVRAAVEAGATRVTLQVRADGDAARVTAPTPGHASDTPGGHEDPRAALGADRFLAAVAGVVDALGGTLIGPAEAEPLDTPVVWNGETVAAVRQPPLHGALDRLLERVAEEMGSPLPGLSREEKQRAVQLLDERGAFTFRRSVEEAAQALQVSRFTVYNYLSRISEARKPAG
jgi:uncharacterized protein YqgV (UPF0045/DUF77 family)